MYIEPLINFIEVLNDNNLINYLYDDINLKTINEILDEIHNISNETQEHSLRVMEYSLEIGRKMNFNNEEMKKLCFASLLHDVGKLYIPKEILYKTCRLSDAEFEIIKTHSLKGYNILSQIDGFKEIAYIILCHHEKYNGKGYPNNYEGDEIPLISRIISIVDAFDAMTSKRSYREPFTNYEAIEELQRCKWKQFDGDIVDSFIEQYYYKNSIFKDKKTEENCV